ncbi:hypothetical protein AUK22_05825 [bacterium CG2_30_54_10]|nr:MAG: hypothetical protein AUK22_05825 [bacterium CG2_30_54_10]
MLRFARNDMFSSLGCRHHLGEHLFSGMHPFERREKYLAPRTIEFSRIKVGPKTSLIENPGI